jgi:D-beta-D-heptose 7-phosphate kinase/D-beta-D-heptose 1-phosphate adenosyltransferase
VVVGDALLDMYEGGRAVRLAPDAPVPVLTDLRRTSSPGGAANVAANLRALGAEVALVSAVGADGAAEELLGALSAAGIRTDGVARLPDRETVVKRRILADGVSLARLDSGDTAPLEAGDARRLARVAAELAGGAEFVVVSDYSGGVVGGDVPAALAGHGLVVLDSKEPLRLRWTGLAAATPNHLEALKALGLPAEPDPFQVDAAAVGRALRERLGAGLLALTLAEAGVLAVEGSGAVTRVPAKVVDDAHPNGAGDTFLSAFSLSLCCGASPVEAMGIGVEAATLAVSRPGTAPVGLAELLARLSGSAEKSLDADMDRVRGSGGRIVLACGSLCPQSPGHLRALRAARGLGDLLVVGLRVEKAGVPQGDALLLEELRSVDHVVPLAPSGQSDVGLVERISPDVCVVADARRAEDRAVAEAVRAGGGRVVFDAALSEEAASPTNGHCGVRGAPAAGVLAAEAQL